MGLISENYQQERLNKYGINIKTKYIVDKKIYERNTDGTINDDIASGVRFLKEYYINNKLVHKEQEFDSRIEYTYLMNNKDNEDYKCPNCGIVGKVKEFIDGCPYCGTSYNIDYVEKDLGSKYHYDKVLKSNRYKIITLLIDVIISMILSLVFIYVTSRTFNIYDISKVVIYGLIMSLILYFFFYTIDAFIILGPIKRIKDKQNKAQIDFWNRTKIDKRVFFNNLNYEISKYYYSLDNIIDFDIIDYVEFKEYSKDDLLYVDVTCENRLVYYENGKITSKMVKDVFTMKRHDDGVIELKDGINLIKCNNCGASIDVTKGICEYCNNEIKYLQEWILEYKK